MMIDAVMYGMIPSAKSANWVSAPPENSCRKASTPPCCGLLGQLLDRVEVDAGDREVGAEPVDAMISEREEDLVAQVRDLEDVLQTGEHQDS